MSPVYSKVSSFSIPSNKKGDNKQKPQSPTTSEVEAISLYLVKLILIPIGGWDAVFLRQLARWRDIALRDGKEFSLNSKQAQIFTRIESQYLNGGEG